FRDDTRTGLLPGHRELLALPVGPGGRRAATVPVRLRTGRRVAHHRREPRNGSTTRRHLPGRPVAEGNAGGVWISTTGGARQPAAALRRIRAPVATGCLCVGNSRRLRAETFGQGS